MNWTALLANVRDLRGPERAAAINVAASLLAYGQAVLRHRHGDAEALLWQARDHTWGTLALRRLVTATRLRFERGVCGEGPELILLTLENLQTSLKVTQLRAM